jgi:transcription antitermination protein NusB
MGTRRRARECALQILYGIDWTGQRADDASELFWSCFAGERPSAYAEIRRACDELVDGVSEHRDRIDRELVDASHNWKLERMSVVDRNILRMGTFELIFREVIPRKVVLNEAIEIAKKYGNKESSAFVNGILHFVSTKRAEVDAPKKPRAARKPRPAKATPPTSTEVESAQ